MDQSTKYIVGIFDDEDLVLSGIDTVKDNGVKIEEVYSPFPVHGIDDKLGIERSRLPRVAFMFGLTGTSLALTMMYYMMGFDWPMIIGGKDATPLPDFIPVTFEMTVLLGALGMVGTFLVISGLKPWATPRLFDIRQTDDKHVMVINTEKNNVDESTLKSILKEAGASEVNEKIFEDEE